MIHSKEIIIWSYVKFYLLIQHFQKKGKIRKWKFLLVEDIQLMEIKIYIFSLSFLVFTWILGLRRA